MKVDSKGITHLLIPLIVVVVGVAAVGTYMLVSSSAAKKSCVSRTIGSGNAGGCTRYAQLMMGYHPTKADGKFGSNTTNNVKNFQKKVGLPQDGVIGKKTWRAMCWVAYNKGPSSATSVVKKAGCTKTMATKKPF